MSNQVVQIGSGGSGVYLDQLLSNLQLAYVQNQKEYIADEASPKIPVPHRTGQYIVWSEAEDMRLDNVAYVHAGSESTLYEMGKSNAAYTALTYGKRVFVNEQLINDGGSLVDIKNRYTLALAREMVRAREYRVANALTTTANWNGNTSAAPYAWDDYVSGTTTSSHPFDDMIAAQDAVLAASGFLPNRVIFTKKGARVLRQHPDFIDRVKYVAGPESIATSSLPSVILDMKVKIAGGYWNTANRNTSGTFTLAPMWGTNCIMYYEPDDQLASNGPETLMTFKSFDYPVERVTYSWFDQSRHGWIVDMRETIDDTHIIAPLTGWLLTGVTS